LKSLQLILVNIMLLSITHSVFAEEAKDYVGIALGQSTITLDGYDQGFFYKAYGGFRSQYIGFEGSYNRLANFDITGANNGSVSASGIEAAAISFLPVSQNLELFVKLGFFSWSATGKINGGFIPKNKGTDLTYSFGAQYDVAEKVTLRAEYQWFKDVLGGDISSVSTGISFKF